MTHLRKLSDDDDDENRDSSSPNSVITSTHSPMELHQPSFLFPSTGRESALELSKGNPFGDGFPDPLCKLNLKETSEFVRAFPMSNKSSYVSRGLLNTSAERRRSSVEHKRLEAPSTPGRPVFNFSVANLPPRKTIPSKWDDAEKWLIGSSSCHESPAHVTKLSDQMKITRHKGEEKLRVSEEKVSSFHMEFHGATSEVFLKDKFTENIEPGNLPHFLPCQPTREGFLFRSPLCEATKQFHEVAGDVHRRDVGTEMTPLGSSTTSRCHTPIKISSPARHNTPADRSGPLVNFSNSINISELKDCHFAKLDLGAHQFDSVMSNWSTREEEEEEVSKSLRHFQASEEMKSVGDLRAATWEDGERTKSCIRYQREAARIQAWVNLQKAKAEARSRKLEVKIQKMRSDLEEKLMKRMAIVHRRAEEWRASAQLQHSQQVLRASEQAQKMKIQPSTHFKDNSSCGCFPCNNHL